MWKHEKKMAFLASSALVVMRLSFVVVRYFCKTMYNKQFLDSVFVISKTIKVSVSVISLSLSASNITKTSSNNYSAVRTGSSNTLFFAPPSGRDLVIPVFFGEGWSLAPDLRSVKNILADNLRSFIVYSPEFS